MTVNASIKKLIELHLILFQISLDDKLCEDVSRVEFGKEVLEEEDFNISQTSAFEFDVNASVASVDADEPAPRFTVRKRIHFEV